MKYHRLVFDTVPTIRDGIECGLVSDRSMLIYAIKMEMRDRAIQHSIDKKPFRYPDHLKEVADMYSITPTTARLYFYSKDVKIPKIVKSTYKFIDGVLKAYHYHYDWLQPEVRCLNDELLDEVIQYTKNLDKIEVGTFIANGIEKTEIKISGKFLPDTLTQKVLTDLKSAFE